MNKSTLRCLLLSLYCSMKNNPLFDILECGISTLYLFALLELDEDESKDWFFATVDQIHQKIYLKRYMQETTREKLKEFGVLRTNVKGFPATTVFKINYEKIQSLLDGYATDRRELQTASDRRELQTVSNNVRARMRNNRKINIINNNIKNSYNPSDCSNGQNLSVKGAGSKALREAAKKSQPKTLIKNKPKPKKILVAKKEYKQLLDYWNISGLRRHTNPSTRVYKESITLITKFLKGTLFKEMPDTYTQFIRKYTLGHFQIAVDNFAEEALDRRVYPASKLYHRSMDLPRFFFDPRSKMDIQSPFLNALHNPPKLINEERKADNPKLTEYLKETFETNLGMVDSGDYLRIVKFSNSVSQIIQRNKSRIEDSLFLKYPKRQAELTWDFLNDKFNGNGMTIYKITAPYLAKDLEEYMKRTGAIR